MRRLSRDPQRTIFEALIPEQAIERDPVLEEVAKVLRRDPAILERVHRDLTRSLKKPGTGRPSELTAEAVLKAAVVKSIWAWPYEVLRDRIADSVYLRSFVGIPFPNVVPDTSAFKRAIKTVQADTVRAINRIVVGIAQELGVDDGADCRTDTTVVETDVRYPTDSGLLWDSIRKITTLVFTIGALAKHLGLTRGFPDRRARAKKNLFRSCEAARKRDTQARDEGLRALYREMIDLAREVADKAREVVARAAELELPPKKELRIATICSQIEHFAGLADRVIDQTERRIFQGESVPADEKIVSIFEDHTVIIRRGKVNKPTEFGRKILLQESASGLIPAYEILEGNAADTGHLEKVLDQHKDAYGRDPERLAADRGFFDGDEMARARERVRVVSVPKPGYKNAEQMERESTPDFRDAQRFRAGIEGRISVLKRGRGMARCLWRGVASFATFIGLGVLTNNLLVIASHLLR